MYTELNNFLSENSIFYNEPLKKHSTFRIGGPADVLVLPKSEEELRQIFDFIKKNKIKYIVIGNGSNILFSDSGFNGIVIKIANGFNKIYAEPVDNGMLVHAGAGVLLSKLANFAYENQLTGLEFASGIPGNVGGAILMNAGAYDGEISQLLFKSKFFDVNNLDTGIKSYDEHRFMYRHSSYEEDKCIILEGTFYLEYGDKDEIYSKMRELNQKRASKQPLEFPSAGSTFKRPSGYYAGKLIEDAGLRGFTVGGACVSEKHCGFVINKGNATCDDVLAVIKYVQDSVLDKFNVFLETEVKIIEA